MFMRNYDKNQNVLEKHLTEFLSEENKHSFPAFVFLCFVLFAVSLLQCIQESFFRYFGYLKRYDVTPSENRVTLSVFPTLYSSYLFFMSNYIVKSLPYFKTLMQF